MIRAYSIQLIVALAVASLLVSVCAAGIGEYNVDYEMAYAGPEVVSLLVVPDGSGPAFDEARIAFGIQVDATIVIELRTLLDEPIVGYPAEDMWLESRDYGLVPCSQGTVADAATDVTGRATFSRPPRAGGWSEGMAEVLINGSPAYGHPGLALHFNSPDINGDLQVNVSDVQLFAIDFYGNYHYRSDLTYDQQVNLSDLLPLVQAMGVACP